MLERRALAALVALIAVAASGCIPISVSRYGTAAPLKQGEMAVDGGFDLVGKSQAYGVDQGKVDGQGIGEHHSALFVPSLEVRYGLTDMLEAYAKGWLSTGALFGGRATFVDDPNVKLAAGLEVGGWSGVDDSTSNRGTPTEVTTTRNYQGNLETLYANLSLHASPDFAVYGGPLFTRLWAKKHLIHTDSGVVTQDYTSTNAIEELGGFVGLAIGPAWAQFCPGVTFYQEADRYPIQPWQGNGWYAFPWMGFSIRPGYARAHAHPAPAPPPVSAPPQ